MGDKKMTNKTNSPLKLALETLRLDLLFGYLPGREERYHVWRIYSGSSRDDLAFIPRLHASMAGVAQLTGNQPAYSVTAVR